MDEKATLKNLFYSIYVELGGTSIDREFDDDDYSVSFDNALRLYRARSRNSVQEGWILLKAQPQQQVYELPAEVDNVTMVKRLRFSALQSGGSFDPFVQSFFNTALRGTSGNFSGLLSYQTISMYESIVGRLFGDECLFEYHQGTNKLMLWHKIATDETIGLHVSHMKSPEDLLRDHQAYRWLKAYTKACCKIILGEKYRKWPSLPGAGGSNTMTTGELVTEGKQELVDLEDELAKWGDGGMGPVIHHG